MKSHLLLMSVGPVQEFIATARQCQDLWYGSHLLSKLSEAAAQVVTRLTDDHVLIFPAGLEAGVELEVDVETGSPRSVANKILARVYTSDPRSARQVALDARESVRQALENEVKRAFRSAQRQVGFKAQVAYAQTSFDELIEFVWAVEELESDERYAEVRARLESTLAAVKASKRWGAPGWESPPGVPKSSLDGVRESVIDEAEYDRPDAERYLRRQFHIKKGERLCGVGLLKRLGVELDPDQPNRPAFHSTSHVASGPTLCAIRRLKPSPELHALKASFEALGDPTAMRVRAGGQVAATLTPPAWIQRVRPELHEALMVPRTLAWSEAEPFPRVGQDGYLLFPSRASDIVERAGRAEGREALQSAQRRLLKAIGHSETHAYYAVLLADGDRMGAALDALESMERQQLLGRHLNAFADACGQLVEGLMGSLIYSGGDDVLALVPLHTALECAERLRELFDDQMVAFEEACDERPSEYRRPTLSVGLAVAHHLEPMGDVLGLAREAERAAKLAGRNALAIHVAPRGGDSYEASGEWPHRTEVSADVGQLKLCQRIYCWAEWLHSGALPRGISHELIGAAARFDDSRGTERESLELEGPFESYVEGIIKNKRSRGGAQSAGDEPIEAIRAYMRARTGTRVDAAERLGHELEIARFFKNAWTQAWLSEPKSTKERA